MIRVLSFGFLALLTRLAAASPALPADEHLGTVAFPVSCAASVQASFNRGVALLHNFWYEEARPQFERILAQDPKCAMAHWGIVMSAYHQIWDRPDEATMRLGERELSAARKGQASERERAYIEALWDLFQPAAADYQTRVEAYAAAMGKLYGAYPADVDAGAFYALALLAAEPQSDTTLGQEHKAMAVLTPLWQKYPNHPGLIHYIIHACDNPQLAAQGLTAARAYGKVASSGPHAVHMPGHIFARLGLWQEDIAANAASVEASRVAGAHHQSGWMGQFHSDDFLVYAYLQRGQEAQALRTVEKADAAITHYSSMSGMGTDDYMTGMFPYYRRKLPIFIDLEMRDWAKVLTLEPIQDAPPETQTQVYWARTIAAGHLHQAAEAHQDLAAYDALQDEVRKGRHAYFAEGTGAKIAHGELTAWTAFADGQLDAALSDMRASAELQDRVGQAEVDIPAREMLADMLLEAGRSQEALGEYEHALQLSPNRFNGLAGAGRAAEKAGDLATARRYYAALLKVTEGTQSKRPELAHARDVIAEAPPKSAARH
jgi:tetratricopeptide (TPR) repeat protein